MIEKILGMLEKRHLKAETLSEAVSSKEDEHHELQPVWTPDGKFKAIRQATSVPLPVTTEELRGRINLLGAAWQFCSFQQAQNPIFKDLSPQAWVEHCDYILGEEVRELVAKTPDGTMTSKPSWTLVLSYEHEVRVRAYEYVRVDGVPLAVALAKARDDERTYRKFFLIPLTLEATRAGQPTPSLKRPRDDDLQFDLPGG